MLVRGAAPSTAFDEAFQRFQQGDFGKAQEEIEKIIEKAEVSKDRIREGVAKDFLGLIFQRQGRLNDAIQRHDSSHANSPSGETKRTRGVGQRR